ncbi:MAG: hypothetical protein KatS3mg111_4001 [Pirellulaceae bacterium]|nr:MAG: hypothetical protein KatS3mg111_4001 [Pirellulaceae bacterium]
MNRMPEILTWLSLQLVLSSSFLSDSQEFRSLLIEVRNSIASSSKCFDNLQAEWEETRDSSEGRTRLLHRFWSRDGKYFRLDSSFVEGKPSNIPYTGERIIVRPEGYVRLIAKDGSSYAIADFGSVEDGMNRLYSHPFFRANIRGYYAYIDDVVSRFLNDDNLSNIEGIEKNGSILVINENPLSDSRGVSYKYTRQIDVARGIVIGWKEVGEKEGRVVVTTQVNKNYEESCVPNEMTVLINESGEEFSTVFRTKVIKEEPADLGLFSLEVQGVAQRAVWTRRLILFVVGLAVLGGFLAFRRRYRNE